MLTLILFTAIGALLTFGSILLAAHAIQAIRDLWATRDGDDS